MDNFHKYNISDPLVQKLGMKNLYVGIASWFSGWILACNAGRPGSIPRRCKRFIRFFLRSWKFANVSQLKNTFSWFCTGWNGFKSGEPFPYIKIERFTITGMHYFDMRAHLNNQTDKKQPRSTVMDGLFFNPRFLFSEFLEKACF